MATILIVEDDSSSRQMLAMLLTYANHRVIEAKDGIEALGQLMAERPDLVFADILMPRMDGFEMVRRMRGVSAFANLPVIFWTATYDEPEAHALAQACGVKYLLAKPAEPEDILHTINVALNELPPAEPESPLDFGYAHTRLLTDKLASRKASPLAPPVTPAPRPILVIEDNPMDIDFMLQAFEEHSISNPVHICRDGEEAMEFIEAHQTPDDANLPLLVLLDLRLPKVDGIEVLRHARQYAAWKQVPFIVVTTSGENSDISRAYELGANSYIIKPVNFLSFSEVIKHIKVYWLLTNETQFSESRRPL
ncbi:MAG: response regulator [Acidobacteria bacterium]|nr:response regulator [Acidobacteriota bacterium]